MVVGKQNICLFVSSKSFIFLLVVQELIRDKGTAEADCYANGHL